VKVYRVYHVDRPERYVDVRSANYWPMKIRERAVEASTVFTWADYASLRIKRIE